MHGDDRQWSESAGQALRGALRALGRPTGSDGPDGGTDTLLVVDDHPTMRVWDKAVDTLVAELAGDPAFPRISTVKLLGSDGTEPDRIRLERPLADPGPRRRLVLMLTDGLASGWRCDAVLPLLRSWGQSGPVAVLHLLPQRLWFRTGLNVTRMRLRAQQAWAPNSALAWQLRETPLDVPSGGGAPDRGDGGAGPAADTVPVPVLELTERWTSAWARLVGGGSAEWLEMSGVLTRAWTPPAEEEDAGAGTAVETPDPDSALPARERVSEFRAAASPTAFAVATRLAAAPLTVPVMRSVAASVPAAGPVHLTELLMSGLVRTGGRPDEAPEDPAGPGEDDVAFSFAPDVRPELLALGRRSDTARVLQDVRTLLRDGPEDRRRGPLPSPSEPLDALTMPVVNRRNVAFHRVELTALRALSGGFLARARKLAQVVQEYDRKHSVSLVNPARVPAAAPPSRSAGRLGPHGSAGPAPGDPNSDTAVRVPADPGARRSTDGPSQHSGPDRPRIDSEGASGMSITQPTRTDERTSQPRVWGNIPPRNPNFTGRMELLELLSARLSEGTTTVLPEAIHGMGGVGKTQLAIEYAYRHQSEYDVVWWIPAERPGQIGQSLVELAQRLGLGTSTEANIAGPAVREALREGRPYSRWLLIFDNADSPERVRDYFPTGGSGTILITSRNRRWGLVGSSLEVDVFTREESVELLRRSGPPLDEREADQLAEALGDLPLALEQAAAWRAETGMPVSEYLRLFENKRSELLEVSPPPDYQLPVAAAWNVSLDHLEARSPAALQLLQLCSYFAPDPISRRIFSGLGSSSIAPELDAALNDPMRLARAIREINRYSLARIDHRTNSIEMHRLVQTVLINRMTAQEQARMRRGAHTLLAAEDPKEPRSAANWPRYAELYGHLIASKGIESDQPWVRELVMNVAKYLYWWGDHTVSCDFSEQAWQTWREIFGEEDQQTLLMGLWLGTVYLRVGRTGDAARLVARLRQVYDRTAPADREDTREDALEALNLEAAVRRAEGDFAAGAVLDEKAYDQARRAFRADDPTTLDTAHNLGVSLRLVGDFKRALELDRSTHNLKVRLYGRDHQNSLVTEGGIAIDVRESGDFIGARALQQLVVDGYREVLGPTNPATYSAMRQLSEACRKEGDQAASLELAREVFGQFTRRYGERHPQSLAAALTLSVAFRQNGDLEAAEDRGRKACDRYRQIFAEDHPHVLSADVDLAVTLRLLDRPQEARVLDEAARDTLTRLLGPGHPSTLACSINLASDLTALGEAAAARELGEETLALGRAGLGEDHPTTLVCAANLALDLVADGAEEEGKALRADTLARMERVLDAPRLRSGQSAPHPATQQARSGRRANCDIDALPL